MNILKLFFAFPDGGVWSNLIASVIWALPTFIFTALHMNKKHKEHMSAINKIHKHLGVKE